MFENTCLTLNIPFSCSPNCNNKNSMINNSNLKDVCTWQEMKLNIGMFYEIWSWAEGIFWRKYGPYAFEGGCQCALCNRARKCGPIFIPPWRLRQLCQKSTTMVTVWLGCSANMHTNSLSCLHSCAHFFFFFKYTTILIAYSSVSTYQIKAAQIMVPAVLAIL